MKICSFLFFCSLLPGAADPDLYHERLRPRFHFTADKGYINDPNGLFFLDGTYHLFFQHDMPFSAKKWGHATSPDLLHWTQHQDALVPIDGRGVFSGSAAIDHLNTTGFGTKDNPPIVAVFTDWGAGQALAYSTDQGTTWTRYDKNPVLTLPGDDKSDFNLSARDPHIMWDENKNRWVLILYHNLKQEDRSKEPGNRKGFSIFTSPDMKTWTYRSHLDNFYVCPDVFQLPVEKTDTTKWIAMDWERYTVGNFDGETFTPEQPINPLDFGATDVSSANQSWKHLPDGRTIQIAWLRGGQYPGMPFTQQLTFPTELTLRKTRGQYFLHKTPIREIKTLYGKSWTASKDPLPAKDIPNSALHLDVDTQSYDLQLDLRIGKSEKINLTCLGQTIVLYHNRITAFDQTTALFAPLTELRILADRTSLEMYTNQGAQSLTFHLLPPDTPKGIHLSARQGAPSVLRATAHEIQSTWPK